MIAVFVVCGVLAVVLAVMWTRYRRLKREHYIRDFALPRGLYERLRKRRPALDAKDCALVARGLRQFFLAYLKSGGKFVSMPSQVVDDLWHEFILYTKAYDEFCKLAFGRFLHHTPAVVLGPERRDNEGLRRVWWHACQEENINPRQAARLPLLFALDAKLGIGDGFVYAPDCKAPRKDASGNVHCGSDFNDSSVDGGTDGFGDSDGDGGGGDSGSDGGGGCGGGGCGGGD